MSILFIDRMEDLEICRTPNSYDNFAELAKVRASLASNGRKVPCFEVSNIAEMWFAENHDGDRWSTITALPSCSVPFEAFWMEFGVPDGYREICKRSGSFFEIKRHDLRDGKGWQDLLIHVFRDAASGGLTDAAFQEAQRELSEKLTASNSPYAFSVRTTTSSMVRLRGRDGVFIHGWIYFALDHRGQVITSTPLLIPTDASEEGAQLAHSAVLPPLLALSFLNCRNVRAVEAEPEKKLSRAFQRRHGRPLISYKMLEIEPMKKVLEAEGGIQQNGLKKALHICRGHFATYTPEKGMLGRKLEEPVTVWKPAHVRGNASEGMVSKNYRIKAPQGITP